jgi:hypothetical protein
MDDGRFFRFSGKFSARFSFQTTAVKALETISAMAGSMRRCSVNVAASER